MSRKSGIQIAVTQNELFIFFCCECISTHLIEDLRRWRFFGVKVKRLLNRLNSCLMTRIRNWHGFIVRQRDQPEIQSRRYHYPEEEIKSWRAGVMNNSSLPIGYCHYVSVNAKYLLQILLPRSRKCSIHSGYCPYIQVDRFWAVIRCFFVLTIYTIAVFHLDAWKDHKTVIVCLAAETTGIKVTWSIVPLNAGARAFRSVECLTMRSERPNVIPQIKNQHSLRLSIAPVANVKVFHQRLQSGKVIRALFRFHCYCVCSL